MKVFLTRTFFAIAFISIFVSTGCTSVPDSVKIALTKEQEVINALEADYQIAVSAYHQEVVKQIEGRLNDIFLYEIKTAESGGEGLSADKVIELNEQSMKQRESLIKLANKTRDRLLSSKNLKILKVLHRKVLQYVKSERLTTSDYTKLITELDTAITDIKNQSNNKF